MTLASARICLDCEVLSEDATCPACCGVTFPLSRWLAPIEREAEVKHDTR